LLTGFNLFKKEEARWGGGINNSDQLGHEAEMRWIGRSFANSARIDRKGERSVSLLPGLWGGGGWGG